MGLCVHINEDEQGVPQGGLNCSVGVELEFELFELEFELAIIFFRGGGGVRVQFERISL